MKSILIVCLVAALVLVLFSACNATKETSKSKEKSVEVWLNSYRDSADSEIFIAQLGAKRNDDQWKEMTLPIEGFTYTAGQIYHLLIRETEADSDGTMHYILEKIIAQFPDPIQRISDIYIIKEVPGQLKITDFKDIRCMIEIDGGKRSMMGHGLCNSFSADISKLGEEEITFGPIMRSKKSCPALKIENLILERMASSRSYTRKNLMLYLHDEQGEILLSLGKVD